MKIELCGGNIKVNLQRITEKLMELPQMNEMFIVYKEKTTIREIDRD